MSSLHPVKVLFSQAAEDIANKYSAPPSAAQVTPPQLRVAIEQMLEAFTGLDKTHGEHGVLPYDDVSKLGNQTLDCLADLSLWAERLGLAGRRHDLETVALGVAQWMIRHEGELATLEPVVNALAMSANVTQSAKALRELYAGVKDVVEHTAHGIRADLDKHDPTRPWCILNFNLGIVATRTQDPSLMREAFGLLERNLPDAAPGFFEEGLKQAQKQVYGPEVRAIMLEYFNKWTVRH
ncbi:MAG: hypothetical protein ACREUA_03205 [Burkholderiales bacterium]